MGLDNLHELINRYENNFYELNNSEHDEIFKWRATKHYKEIWNKRDSYNSFAEMFNDARRDFSVITDNSTVAPSSGVIKMAELEPDIVENAFVNILYADDGGDIKKRQNNLDKFVSEMENLRVKLFPQNWKYKQDRHTASVYLAFYKPEENYIYKSADAEMFSKYIEIGNIGTGQNFDLEKYYNMCNLIVEYLKQHDTLLEKHFKLIEGNDEYYKDESLHLLAFDLMYCARAYNYYDGLEYEIKKVVTKNYRLRDLRKKEEEEKLRRIEELKAAIENTEKALYDSKLELDDYAQIQLVGVEVNQKTFGKGIVTEQVGNRIKVKFADCEKVFLINKSCIGRPKFENDDEVIDTLTAYGNTKDRIDKLETNLKDLIKKLEVLTNQ